MFRIGDRVLTPDGPGTVIASANRYAGRVYYHQGQPLAGGPHVVRLDSGKVEGYPFDRLRHLEAGGPGRGPEA